MRCKLEFGIARKGDALVAQRMGELQKDVAKLLVGKRELTRECFGVFAEVAHISEQMATDVRHMHA